MKRGLRLFLVGVFILLLASTFVSAFSFSEFFGKITGKVVEPVCGNGRLEGEEICDGSNFLDGKIACNAYSQEKPIGIVLCNDLCNVDISTCLACPVCSDVEDEEEIEEIEDEEEIETPEVPEDIPDNCGNSVLDAGEKCDKDLFADDKHKLCGTWEPTKSVGLVSCNTDCSINTDDCSTAETASYCRRENEACFSGSECCSGICRRPFIFFAKRCTKPLPNCGNQIIESGEECDSVNLNGKTCYSLGYGQGVLGCTSQCKFNTINCIESEEPEEPVEEEPIPPYVQYPIDPDRGEPEEEPEEPVTPTPEPACFYDDYGEITYCI